MRLIRPASILNGQRRSFQAVTNEFGVVDVVRHESGVVENLEGSQVGDQAFDPGLGREGREWGGDSPGVPPSTELEFLAAAGKLDCVDFERQDAEEESS